MKTKLALVALVGLLFSAPVTANTGFFAGVSPFASSGTNSGGYAVDLGMDYVREGFRMELLSLGLSSSYESADSVDWIATSALQLELSKGIYGGLKAGLQFVDDGQSILPVGALSLTAIAPNRFLLGIDVGLQSAYRYSKLVVGYHF